MPDILKDNLPAVHEIRQNPTETLLSITNDCLNDKVSPKETFEKLIEKTETAAEWQDKNLEIKQEDVDLQEIDSIRHELGLTGSDIEKFRQKLGLKLTPDEEKKPTTVDRTKRYDHSYIQQSEDLPKKYQEIRKQSSFLEKIIMDREKKSVIRSLKKNGIKDADLLVKALEESAYDKIFVKNNEKEKIDYKKILDKDKKPSEPIKSIAENHKEYGYDIFRKIKLLKFEPEDMDKVDSLCDQYYGNNEIISLSPENFNKYLSISDEYPNTLLYSSDTYSYTYEVQDYRSLNRAYLVSKIKSNELSEDDFEKIKCLEENRNACANDSIDIFCCVNLNNDLDEIKGVSSIIESMNKANENFDNHRVFDSSKTGVDRLLVFEKINKFGDNFKKIAPLNIELDDFKDVMDDDGKKLETIINCLNSENGKYLEAICESMEHPNFITIDYISRNIDKFKTPEGITQIKSIKEIKSQYMQYNLLHFNFKENDSGSLEEFSRYIMKDNWYYSAKYKDDDYISDALKIFNKDAVELLPKNDQMFWKVLDKYKEEDSNAKNFLIASRDKIGDLFTDQLDYKIDYFIKIYQYYGNFRKIPEDIFEKFSPNDQKFWGLITGEIDPYLKGFLIKSKPKFDQYVSGDNFNKKFFDDLNEDTPIGFSRYLLDRASKEDWKTVFGNEKVDTLLKSLPTATDEKRNAFTHNEYDRTSLFFKNLQAHSQEIGFKLTSEEISIATDYIKNFGLSKTPEVYRIFREFTKYNNHTLKNISQEYLDLGINSIDQLKDLVNNVRQLCLDSKPLTDVSNLSKLEIGLLSMVTGHSANRWTRQPIEQIINDFTKDLSEGKIAPLSPEFTTSTVSVDKVLIKNNTDLSENNNYQTVSNEILSGILKTGTVDDLKESSNNLLNKKIEELSLTEPNDFIKKQLEIFKSGKEIVQKSESVDSLLESLLSLNINFGREQEKYNSVLRQLVYRKVLTKHNSPDFVERLRSNLENNQGPQAVSDSLNFLNNLVKDHALNFETNNEEKYWTDKTFATIKKYSKVFKKNLNISLYTKELESISSQFEHIKSDTNLDIEMIPDRGLIGEMAGYMADVCYTKVYPLLKQYPNLVPYKFISKSDDGNSELIGSTLVFKVDTKDGEPALLIRAFDVPLEQTIDIGGFFEKFVDSLSVTAKKMGINKIIAAGTSGTISNYSLTTNYVTDNYVKEKGNIPLKEAFDFNNYNITNQTYLIRDLS